MLAALLINPFGPPKSFEVLRVDVCLYVQIRKYDEFTCHCHFFGQRVEKNHWDP